MAATLKAKVCTSLSSRYFTSAAPSWRRRYHFVATAGVERTAVAAGGKLDVQHPGRLDIDGTGNFDNRLRQTYRNLRQ